MEFVYLSFYLGPYVYVRSMESLSISYKEFIFYIIWLLNVFAINMQCASIGLIEFDILILSEARQVIPETYEVCIHLPSVKV